MTQCKIGSIFRKFCEIGNIVVIHVDLSQNELAEHNAYSLLDETERARWLRFRSNRSRREFALCRAVLRSILCNRLGCENSRLSFEASEHGKPFALVGSAGAPVSFNVSHSGNHGLIAFASGSRLGVDVEVRVPRTDLGGLAQTVFGPGELAEFMMKEEQEKLRFFYALWTLKEALIKALGTGFSLNPSSFEIPLAMRQGTGKAIFRFPMLPNVCWKLENLGNAEFAAAIAYELNPVGGA